ncbi:hypothetical protein PBCV1_a550R [Paramecium bursaria Chlorella virus 1]|uniref:Uncharacterized protein n=1 Tax=Paramecium bursaria Chlorella virus 1 TaxID=10506 RepID=O41032_PBCV1|nr:hypothetical protein PBCV1_a550R [Paramecium bursaria Chlorella virus 1]AAC96997.1 hypothetical protein [Paramecium bursaria Chlorella virus 1]
MRFNLIHCPKALGAPVPDKMPFVNNQAVKLERQQRTIVSINHTAESADARNAHFVFLQHFMSNLLLVIHSCINNKRGTIRKLCKLRHPLTHDVFWDNDECMIKIVDCDSNHGQNGFAHAWVETQKPSGSPMRRLSL